MFTIAVSMAKSPRVRFVSMIDRKTFPLWPLLGAALIGLPVAMFVWPAWKRHVLSETKRNGATIVRALEKFHADHECYPESLSGLTPKYIPDIPPARWGEALWIYQLEGSGFNLQVNEDKHTGDGHSHRLEYSTTSRKWEMGD